jgi:hypothetical protein
MEANNTEFGEPSSIPYLANRLTFENRTTNGGQTEEALVGIDALPARSHTIIKIPIVSQSPDSQSESELVTYVRSDAAVGYHNTHYLFLFYALLSIYYVFFAIDFGEGRGNFNKKSGYKIDKKYIGYIVGMIFAGIIAANLLLYLPFVEGNSALGLILPLFGVIIIPVAFIFVVSHYVFREKKYNVKDRH